MKAIREIGQYVFGAGSAAMVAQIVEQRRSSASARGDLSAGVFLVDEFFERAPAALPDLGVKPGDVLKFISTQEEPKTAGIDALMISLRQELSGLPCAVVGVGGGITLDTAKAVSNLFSNPGDAADYQGWDLVRNPGVFKVGVPTISGTGAESSRTCVMTNVASGLKLGMNSDFTLYDYLVLDPALTATVDRNQYFYTGMDTYVHGIESLAGSYRNAVGDALSRTSVDLCRSVFLDGDMMSDANRERLMVASYLGGRAIATGFVGVVHPVSAALSVVLGTHHCLANCLTMKVMDEFYPEAHGQFMEMVEKQGVVIPSGLGASLTTEQLERMCASPLLHEKPLTNALGPGFREVLTSDRLATLFRRM